MTLKMIRRPEIVEATRAGRRVQIETMAPIKSYAVTVDVAAEIVPYHYRPLSCELCGTEGTDESEADMFAWCAVCRRAFCLEHCGGGFEDDDVCRECGDKLRAEEAALEKKGGRNGPGTNA